MTEGISKEYLEGKLLQAKKYNDVHLIDLLKYLISQCTELDPWLPIDKNTPKNTRVLLFFPGYGSYDGGYLMTRRDGYVVFAASASINVNPTCYKLLPEDPK